MLNDRVRTVIIGTDHKTIEDAIAADLVSSLPIIGAVTNFMRVLDSETRPQKALQVLDTISQPIPIINVITPTNTLLYLDKKGLLPVKIDKIDSLFKKFDIQKQNGDTIGKK